MVLQIDYYSLHKIWIRIWVIFLYFCSKIGPQNTCVSPKLCEDNSLICHGAQHFGSDSSVWVLGRGQGTIPDLWSGCFHTFPSLSRCCKSVENRDTPETIRSGGRTLIWKVAPGGAKIPAVSSPPARARARAGNLPSRHQRRRRCRRRRRRDATLRHAL